MPLSFLKKREKANSAKISYPPITKNQTRGEDPTYSAWVANHRWTSRNEVWSLRQIERFVYRPTISILIQSMNPKPPLLYESLCSIFNQVYPFHELFIVDRGSLDNEVKKRIEQAAADPRVKVSFQKGTLRDQEAVARIMKKVTSQWLLLMGAEDVLAPNALYNMVAVLQTNQEADFVYADSDLIDEAGLRFSPQFKPIWAVGAHYPLGYYQHPVLLNDRLVAKLKGHERVSALMEEGILLDEASNHSRWAEQAPGILYHARERGLKNETPPAPVLNVFLNENLVAQHGEIHIDQEIRARAEPAVPLDLLWIVDSLEQEDVPLFVWSLAKYLREHSAHRFTVVSTKDGMLRRLYEEFSTVSIASTQGDDRSFDIAVESSTAHDLLGKISIPKIALISRQEDLNEKLQSVATVTLPWRESGQMFESGDGRNILRALLPAIPMEDIKLYKQQTSPIGMRTQLGIDRSARVVSIIGPTIPEKGQMSFAHAAVQVLRRNPDAQIHFFIVGERAGEYHRQLKDFISKSGFDSFMHLLPEALDPGKNYPYYWVSDLCVSCATEEIFPISTLEAMAFKKPVIGSRNSRAAEIIEEDGNGYLVDPQNVNELAQRMEELALNKDLAEAFGRRSLEIVMERFTMQKVARTFENYLRESIVYE